MNKHKWQTYKAEKKHKSEIKPFQRATYIQQQRNKLKQTNKKQTKKTIKPKTKQQNNKQTNN